MTSSAPTKHKGRNAEKVSITLLWHTLAAGALLSAFVIWAFVAPSLRAMDFAAFYCAGESLAQHADPYRAMPLGSCEHRVASGPFFHSSIVLPAPLPPYAIAALTVASRVPYPMSQHILDVLSIAALIMAALLLGALMRSGTMVALFALGPIAWSVFLLGQPLLVMLGALVASAALLKRGHERWAAASAAILTLEPHIGLSVCVSLFLSRPRTRLAFLAIAIALLLISAAIVPWRLTTEYFASVLPLHARSEATSPMQYSSVSFLSSLGMPIAAALTLGSIQYLFTVGFGILVARSASTRFNDVSALVFVPSLFAVLGGTFIHYTDFLLAIPAGLLLLKHTRFRGIVGVSIIALYPHLHATWGLPGVAVDTACATLMLLYLRRPVLALSCLVTLVAIGAIATSVPPPKAISPVPATAYAEESWTQYIRSIQAPGTDLIKRAPEWLGVIVLCSLAAGGWRNMSTETANG